MKHETIDDGGLPYSPCRYGMSRIVFRGPRRDLTKPYIAFIGGTETYGKYIESPFPSLVERDLRRTCVNFGCVNGGVDAFVNDPTIMAACHDADLTVVQIMGANFLSNRFYSVHPRRNDRFLRASTVLQAIYSDVDFSDFNYTRHMLGQLYRLSAERFEIVIAELREAWTARMKNMLGQIGPKVILLWFSRKPMTDKAWDIGPDPLQADPLFITKSMMDELRPMALDMAECIPSDSALRQGTKGMIYPQIQMRAAAEMLGIACHQETSATLSERIRTLVQ